MKSYCNGVVNSVTIKEAKIFDKCNKIQLNFTGCFREFQPTSPLFQAFDKNA